MTYEYVELDPKVEYVKIHGLQRSGTNYLTFLVNENFENARALVNLGGWKHGPYQAPWALRREVHILAATKNPYAWLVSMYNHWGRRRVKRIGTDLGGVEFDHFVRNRVIMEKQKDVPMLFRASNPVQHWNNMNFHWSSIRLNEKRLLFVRYETLLENPMYVLDQIQQKFDLVKRKESKLCEMVFTPAGERPAVSENKFVADYYHQQQYLEDFTPSLLNFVNHELDLNVMAMLGYRLIAQ